MSARAKIIGLRLAALVLGGVALQNSEAAEPKYRGRTLRSWLQQCSDTTLMETQRLAQAQEAVRAIGAQKALPTLLSLVQTRDTPVRAWTIDKAEKYRIRFVHLSSAIECQLQGIAGFEVLGTNCASAVGELTQLLDDKELAFVAARCLDNIGKSAEQALCHCLTNTDWHVRELSISALASVTDDVEVYINRVKPGLTDVEPAVRLTAVQAIAAQTQAPELAVPLLISALQDTHDGVVSQAASGLPGFGTNAWPACSALTNLATTGRDGPRGAALKAMAAITPGDALPMWSNAVVNGSPPVMGTALRELKAIAPEPALKMTLAEFHSADVRRRMVAISVAGTYNVETPGIPEALRTAADDPDLEIASRAVNTMRTMLRRQKERVGTKVLLPNEPSSQGKPLGEWLSMWQQDLGFATNAVEALRHMGSNVIPALLARLTYKEPVFHLDDYDVSMGATRALVAIRDQAKPALPVLVSLMDGDDAALALRAMVATVGTGTDAVPCLMRGLTNQFPELRGEAANFLTELCPQFPGLRQQLIPCVARLLDDPDENVRRRATNELAEIDPQAAARAGIVTRRRPR